MSTSPVASLREAGTSPSASSAPSPSNANPIAAAQEAVTTANTTSASAKITQKIDRPFKEFLTALKAQGHDLSAEAQQSLRGYMAAIYASTKSGANADQVQTTLVALKQQTTPEALKVIVDSLAAWAKQIVAPKKKTTPSSPAEPPKAGLSTKVKVAILLTEALLLGTVVYLVAADRLNSLRESADAPERCIKLCRYTRAGCQYAGGTWEQSAKVYDDCVRACPPVTNRYPHMEPLEFIAHNFVGAAKFVGLQGWNFLKGMNR